MVFSDDPFPFCDSVQEGRMKKHSFLENFEYCPYNTYAKGCIVYDKNSDCWYKSKENDNYYNLKSGKYWEKLGEYTYHIKDRDDELPIFIKIKVVSDLYQKAIDVEIKKRGHSESSRIKIRWGDNLLIIKEALDKELDLPENTEKALDKIEKELLDYIQSAGEYFDSVESYICLETMVDVMLSPAK